VDQDQGRRDAGVQEVPRLGRRLPGGSAVAALCAPSELPQSRRVRRMASPGQAGEGEQRRQSGGERTEARGPPEQMLCDPLNVEPRME
jgi:hypothetical protein